MYDHKIEPQLDKIEVYLSFIELALNLSLAGELELPGSVSVETNQPGIGICSRKP